MEEIDVLYLTCTPTVSLQAQHFQTVLYTNFFLLFSL